MFVTVTFLYQLKMGGLSSSASTSTAIVLNSEQVQKHFPVILIIIHKFNFINLYLGYVFESTYRIFKS